MQGVGWGFLKTYLREMGNVSPPSPPLFLPQNTNVIAGALATILDYEATLKKEATNKNTGSQSLKPRKKKAAPDI